MWRSGVPCVLLVLTLAVIVRSANNTSRGDGICESMDIRNNATNLAKLRGCRVIEGVLQIVLLEKSTYKAFENLSFPLLTEITGHLVMYRVAGLKSLEQLFPNLAVIRGHRLFKDYALVIYELQDLEVLGLKSLTNIERGSVRIEKNGKLCFANTIDWSLIAQSNPTNNVVKANKELSRCGTCSQSLLAKSEHKFCAKDSVTNMPLCWNENTCQKVCPQACGNRTCTNNGTCCDYNCLGGCDEDNLSRCNVCRDYSLSNGKETKCLRECPKHMFKLSNRRCISETECRKLPSPKFFEASVAIKSYKALNGTCVYECPLNYNEFGTAENATCIPCNGTCIRHCRPVDLDTKWLEIANVDSLQTAQLLRGCTHLRGSLEISVQGGYNVMKELQECLGAIEEIDGYLKVSRSYSITTLYFLNNLKVIHGLNLYRNQSLSIYENRNLEQLWDWGAGVKLKIERGTLFIHSNSKLCLSQIIPLRNMTAVPSDSDYEISPHNNGDMAVCEKTVLDLMVSTVSANAAIFSWDHFCADDERVLLGYIIYYIKAPKNVTIYDGRDACTDPWNVEDFQIDASINSSDAFFNRSCKRIPRNFLLVTKLEPYTRYAAYVKTFTTLTDQKGAQSPIVYFRTKPSQPSSPIIIKCNSTETHQIYVKWQKPFQPNGNLTDYLIIVEYEMEDELQHAEKNYCNEPLTPSQVQPYIATISQSAPVNSNEDECQCESKQTSKFADNAQSIAREAMAFENELQNRIYISKIKGTSKALERPRRSLKEELHSNVTDDTLTNKTGIDGFKDRVVLRVSDKVEEVTVSDLRHYGRYLVQLKACRELDTDENSTIPRCSQVVEYSIRVAPLDTADAVTGLRAYKLSGNGTQEIKLTWDEPKLPNALILKYSLSLTITHADGSLSRSPMTCITRKEYLDGGGGYILKNLPPGNYTVAVMATSLSGNGPWSNYYSVIIPDRLGNEWVGGLVGGLVCATVAIIAAAWWARRGRRSHQHDKLFASVNPEYVASVYVPDEWEVLRENVQLVKELGQGSFGMVYEGIAKNIIKGEPETRCAIKTVNEHATDRERVDFLNEASVMKAFDTAHVVRLLGVVSRGQPTLVIMELMQLGDLKSYLRAHRAEDDHHQPSLLQIRQMAIEIADGMAYLSAKKFVHRDLAARNCMVAEDLTVKVGDFGMTRDIYETDYYRKGSKGLLPVRWMSPESLKDGVFSSHSDVWSYGVVLWEMATLAMQPYQGLSNEQVLRYVVEGGVMERPEGCPEDLYELMRWCWRHSPDQRPDFLQVVAELAMHAHPRFRQRSFFHTPQAQDLYLQITQRAGDEEAGETARHEAGAGTRSRLAEWVRSVTRSQSPPAPEQRALVMKPQPPNGHAREP